MSRPLRQDWEKFGQTWLEQSSWTGLASGGSAFWVPISWVFSWVFSWEFSWAFTNDAKLVTAAATQSDVRILKVISALFIVVPDPVTNSTEHSRLCSGWPRATNVASGPILFTVLRNSGVRCTVGPHE